MIIIFKIDNRLSQITEITRDQPTENIIVHAFAIVEEEVEVYTCIPESPIYPLLESLLYNSTPFSIHTRAKSTI